MTTATKSKRKNAQAELKALETAEREACAERAAIGTKVSGANRRLHGWMDDSGALAELHSLRIREPELFVEDGSAPRDPKNAAGVLQAEIDGLVTTITELTPRHEHLARVESRARERREAHTAETIRELFRERIAVAEAVQAETHEALARVLPALERHIGFIQGGESLLGCRHDWRSIGIRTPGLELVADLKRLLERAEVPLPIPELPDE